MTSAAVPEGRHKRRRRFGREWNRRGQRRGTLMRHFLLFGAVAALAFGMGMTTLPAGLIAASGSADGGASCLSRTRFGAIALAAIAMAANNHRLAATRTQVASSGEIHGQKRANGGRQQHPLRGILGMQRCPSGQRGAASELAWWLGPMSLRHLQRLRCFYRNGNIGATAPPSTRIPNPAALRLPDGSLLRKPPAGCSAGSRLKPR